MIQDTPVGCKLNGFFRGEVIQHLTHGYCKIFIPSVHPLEWREKPDLLPPAEQASSLFAGTNTGSGVFTYPNIGSVVWIFFANNDQNYPVYFASSLGGQNAFGQYDRILDRRQFVISYEDKRGNRKYDTLNYLHSDRHLITSGKTHVELFENGKISAIVVDPDRRDAKVDYDNTYISQISNDYVTDRPVVTSVDNEMISSIDCQFVLDNHEHNGTISCSTHYFDPRQTLSTIYLSDEQKTTVSNIYSISRYDTANVTQNDSLHSYTALSSYNGGFVNVSSDNIRKSLVQKICKNAEKFQTEFLTDGNSNIVMQSNNTKSIADTYVKQQGNVNSTSSFIQDIFLQNTSKLDQNGNGCFQTAQDYQMSLMKNNCPDSLMKQQKFTSDCSLKFLNGEVHLNELSTVSKMSDTVKGINSLTSHVDNSMHFQNFKGSEFRSVYNFRKDAAVIESQINDTHFNVNNILGAKFNMSLRGTKSLNGDVMYDTAYSHSVSSNEAKIDESMVDSKNKVSFSKVIDENIGKISVTIQDDQTKNLSQITMDKYGNVAIGGSSSLKIVIGNGTIFTMDKSGSIEITSPNNDVKIHGNTSVIGTLNVSNTITGGADIKASGCTLNTHVHKVPPHCPSSGITLAGQ